MTMKIALIRQHFRPDGGAERIVLRTLESLRASAIDVSVICRSWQADSDGYRILTVNPPYLGRTGKLRSFVDAARKLIDSQQFDLVQAHERIPGCSLYRAGDGVHRVWLRIYAQQLSALGRWALYRNSFHRLVLQLEEALYAHPNLRAVICNSEMVKREIHAEFKVAPEKLRVIYNGVDTQFFNPHVVRDGNDVRDRFNIPRAAPLMLFVGSGFQRKGLACAIAALAQTATAHLLVVGTDSHPRHYHALAHRAGVAARVHWCGVTADVRPYYGAADALVLPSWYDPFPNVILEAMACGLPVITSNNCGGGEFIDAYRSGLVCAAGDNAALAAGIAYFSDRGIAKQCGEFARQRVEAFDIAAMREQLLALYRELIAR